MKKLLFVGFIALSCTNYAFGMSSNGHSKKGSTHVVHGKGAIRSKFGFIKNFVALIVQSDALKYFSPKEIALILDIEKDKVRAEDLEKLNINTKQLEKELVKVSEAGNERKDELDFFVFGERD